MNAPTEAMVQAPSRLALDNIVETLAALVDEAMAITGSPRYYGQATITLSHVPAHIWHALPEAVRVSPEYTWKHIARHGSAHIQAFCEHDAECSARPRPPCIYCRSAEHWSQDCPEDRS